MLISYQQHNLCEWITLFNAFSLIYALIPKKHFVNLQCSLWAITFYVFCNIKSCPKENAHFVNLQSLWFIFQFLHNFQKRNYCEFSTFFTFCFLIFYNHFSKHHYELATFFKMGWIYNWISKNHCVNLRTFFFWFLT